MGPETDEDTIERTMFRIRARHDFCFGEECISAIAQERATIYRSEHYICPIVSRVVRKEEHGENKVATPSNATIHQNWIVQGAVPTMKPLAVPPTAAPPIIEAEKTA